MVFDAESAGATVIREFGCVLGPAEWGGPFPLFTDDTHTVITPSGNTVLKCSFQIPEGFEPARTIRSSGFPCFTFLGPTTDSEAVATRGGSASLSCSVRSLLWVNTTDDVDDGLCDDAHCSLREAIHASNSLPGRNQVKFRIPGPGPHTIRPSEGLPPLFDPVTIDGTSEPDFQGTPVVELDGSGIAGDAHGLVLPGGNATVRGLVINRFSLNGILIHGPGSSGNVVEGNFIGTDVTGTVPLGNGLHGISVVDAPGNRVGGATAAARNVIAGNAVHGVEILFPGASGNTVQGNYIGTDVTGTAPLGNGEHGVLIVDAAGNRVGGAMAAARNVISGNAVHGVHVIAPGASGNSVQGNYIGTDATGTASLGNGLHGVSIADAPGNLVGGTTAAAGNLISGNAAHGVEIIFPGASGNAVQGNYIGTDATGTVDLGNGASGVIVVAAGSNVIGGTDMTARNLISGNGNEGVTIVEPPSTGNLVQGNYIGTDVAGTAALGNGNAGVILAAGASGNSVGGTAPGAGNVISGNLEGVTIAELHTRGNVIQGNRIGTDASGTAPLSNGTGVLILGSENLIGGMDPGAGNLISGNIDNGISLELGAAGNVIFGNLIGTDVSGAAPLGNGGWGVFINGAFDNRVGSRRPGARNVIASNRGGVRMLGGAHGNAVRGNSIGTDISGTVALGHTAAGVLLSEGAFDNRIGDQLPGAGNIVAFSDRAGVRLLMSAGPGNAIRGNSIFGNQGLGIDLGPASVTYNDPGDPDLGPNDLQNFPILDSATGSSLTISGTLNSAPDSGFRIEFFANGACDPVGHGEGETFLGYAMVTTDASGDAAFEVTLPTTIPTGTFVTATATAPNLSTSEFSPCITAN